MPVASSNHVVGHLQADGRRYVRETHTLTVGAPVVIEYLAAADADYVAIRDARAALLNEQLAQQEFETILGNGA